MSTVFIPAGPAGQRRAASSRSSSTATPSARSSTTLVEQHPSLGSQLLTDDGDLNRFVNVYVNGQDVRYLAGLDTPVAPGRRGPPAAGDGRAADEPSIRARSTPRELPRHGGRYDDILDAIGHTPLVEIPRMSPKPSVRIFAKLEMLNPTGLGQGPRREVPGRGPRDARAAQRGLDHPRADVGQHRHRAGDDRPAEGLPGRARHARQRHQRAAPDGRAVRRRGDRLARARSGRNGAIALAKHLVSQDERFVMPYQYGNAANPRAHYETTGPEILADCPEIDVVRGGARARAARSWASSRYLREHKPGVRIVAAEPLPGEKVQGLRSLDDGFIPEILDPSLIDAKYLVSNRDAIAALRELVFREGIFAGPSCGAVLVAAARVAHEMESGTIVALLPDGGWKYLRRARSRPTSTRWTTRSRAASTGGDPVVTQDVDRADRPAAGRRRRLRRDRRALLRVERRPTLRDAAALARQGARAHPAGRRCPRPRLRCRRAR